MVCLSRLAGGGLLLAMLALALDGKPALPLQTLQAPAGGAAALRLLRDLRPDSKQSRVARERMVHPGDSRRLKRLAEKALGNNCFDQRLDRIGSVSGLGCNRPKPTVPPSGGAAALQLLQDLRPDSKQWRATWDRIVHPKHHAGGGRGGDSRRLKVSENTGSDETGLVLSLQNLQKSAETFPTPPWKYPE